MWLRGLRGDYVERREEERAEDRAERRGQRRDQMRRQKVKEGANMKRKE
jgi:hypothetical protein